LGFGAWKFQDSNKILILNLFNYLLLGHYQGGAHPIVEKKSLRGKPRSIMFLGFNSLLSQQAAGNLTQERLIG